MTDTGELEQLPRKYRKTALIEATQWHAMGDHSAVLDVLNPVDNSRRFWIDTLEGGHVVTPGDWIATGIQGEHWPIKPDIFAATYEPADEAAPTLASENIRLRARCNALEGAGQALLEKLDAALPHIENAVVIATNHHCPYGGPQFGIEIEVFRTALADTGEDGNV